MFILSMIDVSTLDPLIGTDIIRNIIDVINRINHKFLYLLPILIFLLLLS